MIASTVSATVRPVTIVRCADGVASVAFDPHADANITQRAVRAAGPLARDVTAWPPMPRPVPRKTQLAHRTESHRQRAPARRYGERWSFRFRARRCHWRPN